MSIAACVNSQARRHVVAFQLVTAAGAKLVCGPDRAEAVSATGGELVIALRAEMEVTLDVGAAGGAGGNQWSPQEEVENCADSSRHDETDQHPEARTHGAAGRIFADVADHQNVERGEESPGDVEVRAKPEGRIVVLRLWEDDPEVVLDQDEDSRCTDDRPYWNQPGIVVRIDRFGFSHT